MTLYVRVGNRTLTGEEASHLTPKEILEIKTDAEKANQKRLENMRNSLGIKNPQAVTLDVTPAGVAARKAAIEAEEARIALETQEVTEDLGPEKTSFIGETETPAESTTTKKSKSKK